MGRSFTVLLFLLASFCVGSCANTGDSITDSRVLKAKREIMSLVDAINSYYDEHGDYPDLTLIRTADGEKVKNKDPWGRYYGYGRWENDDKSVGFVIFSPGADEESPDDDIEYVSDAGGFQTSND